MQLKNIISIAVILIFSTSAFAQKKTDNKPTTIKWYSFEEAMAKNSQFPKKKYLLMFIPTGVVGVKKWMLLPLVILKL